MVMAMVLGMTLAERPSTNEISISHVTCLLPFNCPSLPGSSIRKPVRFRLDVGPSPPPSPSPTPPHRHRHRPPSPSHLHLHSHPHYALQTVGGCFNWHTTHDHVLELEGIPTPACPYGFSSVWVIPTDSSESERSSAWVWAELIGEDTAHRVECEVFVDHIHRLEVLTSTRVVNVGDTESIDLQAFDKQNNVFSTLAGYVHDFY